MSLEKKAKDDEKRLTELNNPLEKMTSILQVIFPLRHCGCANSYPTMVSSNF